MNPRWLSITAAAVLALSGCAAGKLQQISGQQLGCAPDDVDIDNDGRDAANKQVWEAKCKRTWYRCTRSDNAVSCQPFRKRGGDLAGLSAGMVGCAPSDIEIDDDSGWGFGPRSWKAYCRGMVFQCSGAGNMGASCTPIAPPAGMYAPSDAQQQPGAAPPPPPPPAPPPPR